MMNEERLPEEFLRPMAEVIRLMGHPQRLQILDYLDIHGESSVNAVVEGIDGQQGAVSQHLNKMRVAGLIACRRDRRQVLYRIAAENPVTILHCLRRKYQAVKAAGGK
ncbi:helix-turn-helix transcriptional regulator [Victivallis sp. Marseille-Q1083]|uniref:ArsR/SmtB family transcription factor n=1 Tax=Victivallis sp. Marseille-Q1083 TaxID=2717288 RepID=UPI00158C8A21|nr:metalloregulator ArsR/SmtB family transcription factor [Victivallis sp. Marseille-Q1083]